jgi:hypothetical protein
MEENELPIGRHNWFFGNAHDAFVFFAIHSLLDHFCDLIVAGTFFEAHHKIDDTVGTRKATPLEDWGKNNETERERNLRT